MLLIRASRVGESSTSFQLERDHKVHGIMRQDMTRALGVRRSISSFGSRA
jgi:hypothetical protein